MLRNAVLGISLISVMPVFAQSGKDSTTNRQVEIIEVYKPKFLDVQKFESVPVIEKPQVKPAVFTYKINTRQVNTDKIVNPIPMTDLPLSADNAFPGNFVKLGYGNLKTPLAEVYLNNRQSKKYSYGAHYRFLQTNSDLNNGFADFSNHNVKGFAAMYTDNAELGLDVNYRNHKYYYYGYNHSDTLFEPVKKDLERVVSNFDARAYFNSTSASKKKLRHRSQFNFYNFGIDKASETQYAVSSRLYGNVPNLNEFKNCRLSAALGLDYNIFKNDTQAAIKRLFIQADPRFEFEYEGMELTVGFNATVFINGKEPALPYVNPVIRASYPVVEHVANLYAGVDGRYEKQSLRRMIGSNPFTASYDLVNTYENIKSFLGINAKIGSRADAAFEVGYSDISNMPLFITRFGPADSLVDDRLNAFSIKYKQVSMLKFMTVFNYSFSEKVRIGFTGNIYNYEVNEEPYAWQLPNMDGKLNMKFNIRNKLYPYVNILAMGLQKQRSGEGIRYDNSSIKSFYDISLGVDYRFKSKLSAFVQANNLMSSRYQRWYNYPVYGFNIMGGFTMSF